MRGHKPGSYSQQAEPRKIGLSNTVMMARKRTGARRSITGTESSKCSRPRGSAPRPAGWRGGDVVSTSNTVTACQGSALRHKRHGERGTAQHASRGCAQGPRVAQAGMDGKGRTLRLSKQARVQAWESLLSTRSTDTKSSEEQGRKKPTQQQHKRRAAGARQRPPQGAASRQYAS